MPRKPQKKYNKGYSIMKRGENSYWIRVTYKGHRYSYTYHAPEDLTESKQYALAEKEAIKYRDKIISGASGFGSFSGKTPTFAEYLDYVLKTKKELSTKRSTIMGYKYLSARLLEEFGSDTLDAITPYRLNQFYIKLQNSETMAPASAIAIDKRLAARLKEKGITQRKIQDGTGLGINTIAQAVKGARVSYNTANKICAYLEIEEKDFFYIISNAKKISSKTVKEHITLLNTVFKIAVSERIIDYNPVDATTRPKSQKKEVNSYQPEEVMEILDKLSKEDLRWQLITSLLIVTGCRRGEIAGLRWESILWDYNLLRINHEVLYDENGIYSEDNIKNMDEKYVQVEQETMNLFKQYHDEFIRMMTDLQLEEKDYPKYCFFQLECPEMPIHPSSINQFLNRFSNRYGFRKINPHAFRHSLASALIADGVDICAVSRQLGHKQVSTTRDIYAHQINEHQAKIAERIPNIYRKKKDAPDEP